MFDIIIHNGKVVDGSGKKGYPADIGIENGRITAISPGLEAETQASIDEE
jgi:N-acyl-D-amino-acid deacylase